MCWCNPSIRTPNCGRIDCVPPGSSASCRLDRALDISKTRSQEVLREKGGELTFNELIAAIYFQGFKDNNGRI